MKWPASHIPQYRPGTIARKPYRAIISRLFTFTRFCVRISLYSEKRNTNMYMIIDKNTKRDMLLCRTVMALKSALESVDVEAVEIKIVTSCVINDPMEQ
jgi:hypothetical protein